MFQDRFQNLPQEEQEALLGLTLVPGIGAGLATRLRHQMGSAQAVFASSVAELLSIPGIGLELATRITKGPDQKQTHQWLRRIEEEHLHVLVYGTPSYPKSLLRLSSPPWILYAKGSWPDEWPVSKAVALVGTRNPDGRGVSLTRRVTSELVAEGWWIVSGGALGVDTTAHLTTLEQGGVTVGVMASGLDCLYPAQNIDLFRTMVARGGALVSEFPPGTRPERGYFPRRNRLIGGLSCGIVVMQCGGKSGALHTASCARQINVPILTFPGKPQDPLAAGAHLLLREGAWSVDSGADISRRLRAHPSENLQMSLWDIEPSTKELVPNTATAPITPQTEKQNPIPPREKLGHTSQAEKQKDWPALWQDVFDVLPLERGQAVYLDQIVVEVGCPVEDIAAALVFLELEGHVWSTPDSRFGRWTET